MFFVNRMAIRPILIGLFVVLVSGVQAGTRYRGNLVNWGTDWQPPRAEARLDLVGDLSPQLKSRLQGVCYDALEDKDKPFYLYWGLGFRRGNLWFEPTFGWSFRDKELVGAFRLYPQWENWHGYSNLEYQFETQSFYYLTQFNWKATPFFEIGAEAEGWGDLKNHLESHGVGGNLALNFHALKRWKNHDSKLRCEAALQYREMGGSFKPQAIVRLIFTVKTDQ